jgi:hypothetical protein
MTMTVLAQQPSTLAIRIDNRRENAPFDCRANRWNQKLSQPSRYFVKISLLFAVMRSR